MALSSARLTAKLQRDPTKLFGGIFDIETLPEVWMDMNKAVVAVLVLSEEERVDLLNKNQRCSDEEARQHYDRLYNFLTLLKLSAVLTYVKSPYEGRQVLRCLVWGQFSLQIGEQLPKVLLGTSAQGWFM